MRGGVIQPRLAGTIARRVLSVRTRVRALQSGTARKYLEHHALTAALALHEEGAFVPWVSYLFPSELLASYGLTPLIPEVAATTLMGTDFREELEAAMNRSALPRDLCSYHRAARAALDDRLLPAPSICLGTTPLCTAKECLLDALAQEHDVPFISIHVPLPPDEGSAHPDQVSDVADQLRALHERLGPLTGRRPALSEAIHNSNRAARAWRSIDDSRMSGDLLLDGRHTFAFAFLGQILWGTVAGARGFEKLLTERGRSDLLVPTNGSGGALGPRPRLVWLHTVPHHDDTAFELIRARGGAVVFEEMGRTHLHELDAADPFPGLARRLIEHPVWGSSTRRARLVVELTRGARADGVIHFNHWGCRQGLGTLPVLREVLAGEGIPFLTIDGDALDRPGGGSNSGVDRLESFLEML